MRLRTISRKSALQMLYQAEITNELINEVITKFWNITEYDSRSREFADKLVKGVIEHLPMIDQSIDKHAKNWKLHRMSTVDLCILRLGTYELFYLSDIPPAVSINEAIELAKEFSTEKSAKFVNGILDQLKKQVERENYEWLGESIED